LEDFASAGGSAEDAIDAIIKAVAESLFHDEPQTFIVPPDGIMRFTGCRVFDADPAAAPESDSVSTPILETGK